MVKETNIFGTGDLYESTDLLGALYVSCCACKSIYSEFSSWANYIQDTFYTENIFVDDPQKADVIIVLSCQVTDLAILNDLRKMEDLISKYPDKQYFIGGCLARRFDIPLPDGVKRLSNVKMDYFPNMNPSPLFPPLIHYESPFWVKDFKESKNSDGNLFRNDYPIRIGVGCNKKCSYCTIKVTRGKPYELDTFKAMEEFLALPEDRRSVLIADSPSAQQIKEWCIVAKASNRPIAIRNIEPNVALSVFDYLKDLSKSGLLRVLHCPVQSANPDLLRAMHRDVDSTLEFIEKVRSLSKENVGTGYWFTYLATNIIIDYENFENSLDGLEVFDYISWNPYWNGVWDRAKAEERYEKYITHPDERIQKLNKMCQKEIVLV